MLPTSQSWSGASTVSTISTGNANPSFSNSAGTTGHNQQTHKINKPVIGSKVQSHGSSGLKASTILKQIHLYVGNLDVDITTEQVKEFVRLIDPANRLHHNELIRSSRLFNPRSISAHIAISGIDKEKVLTADCGLLKLLFVHGGFQSITIATCGLK